MFCPNCGQEKVGSETSFCSRCGFLLTGTALLLQTGGNLPSGAENVGSVSRRKKGLKQGLFIFLLTFLVVPLVAMLCVWLRLGPEPIGIIAVLLSVGGLLRMAYAWLLEEDDKASPSTSRAELGMAGPHALPPQQTIPAASYVSPAAGSWRDTNTLEPRSVVENTTQLLEHEQRHQ